MNVQFKKSFLKDLTKLNNQRLKDSIYDCIMNVEKADKITQIKNLKKDYPGSTLATESGLVITVSV